MFLWRPWTTVGHFFMQTSSSRSTASRNPLRPFKDIFGILADYQLHLLKVKTSFDHHKGVFGTVAMLKTVSGYYPYATTDEFGKVKVCFVQAAGNQLHLWSLCYKENSVYDLWRETYLTIRPSFDDKADMLPELLQFFWNMKALVNESILNITNLRQNHIINNRSASRYNKHSPPLLTEIINPPIIKLVQHDDSKGMADLGPFYSPHQSPTQSRDNSPHDEE